ncbi:MAG: hypothetical protein E7176_05620 [Erysipelotrichaceae bacterium]|nr:hypothetical protein [Erysipelotrichaceae bacterium]
MKKIFIILIMIFSFTLYSCDNNQKSNEESKQGVKAVWWWNDELSDEYLEFAYDNGINTIYYCTSKFNDETSSFIGRANDLNIDVYLLSGEYSWIEDRTGLNRLIEKFDIYQSSYENKFKGLHLDIEPHQHSEFKDRREELISGLIKIAYDLSKLEYDVEFDIPFWLEDIITIDEASKEAYKWMIDYADSITIMSYRDTKEAILDVAEDEYVYADSIGKKILISVETYSLEGDFVSFHEEGRRYMNDIVNDIYQDNILGVNGIVIHHIQRWYEMED